MDIISIAHAAEAASETQSTGVPAMFGLSAKLFLAQLINFGIVLFVFWKWVFPPVVKGLQARTDKIKKSLDDAEHTAQEKESFAKWKTDEISNTRKEAAEIINKAKTDAEGARAEILDKAKADQQRLVEQTKEQLAAEQARSVSEVKQEIATLVVGATEKILRHKLDAKTDKDLIAASIKDVTKS